ncbi:porphobilinogen synthase [Suicoccus acidiformans]|uniref:Delta-aminolevulinic acid dehydratase n=1 Tax=Suicoccus acidiformans TaxID=2036206 RepID=A0A347WM05_9LACT|nr:porphobilinogen synthase [Suicoccus acidiformans]AXY26112.1 porphobilinogen synthase [Suicoccus acidiformans]
MTYFRRHRRLRKHPGLRAMLQENQLRIQDLIYPIFVKEEGEGATEILSMPGIYQHTLDSLEEEIKEVLRLGIPAVLLFGIPAEKDALGSQAYASDGIIQQAIPVIKALAPDLLVTTDTCLCEYTDHGHCGCLDHAGYVLNDESLELHKKAAIAQARAGADIIAPSSAMDGFVHVIRQGLDEAGFPLVPIMSYAIKYSSAFYGPFRDAADSAPSFGDRKTYQMPVANRREAMRELASDIDEGADFVMVKPALAYMDIIRDVRERTDLPIVTYNVSGEFSMIKAASQNAWIDEESIVMESLLGMKRAGADLIITYFAKDVARWLSATES